MITEIDSNEGMEFSLFEELCRIMKRPLHSSDTKYYPGCPELMDDYETCTVTWNVSGSDLKTFLVVVMSPGLFSSKTSVTSIKLIERHSFWKKTRTSIPITLFSSDELSMFKQLISDAMHAKVIAKERALVDGLLEKIRR